MLALRAALARGHGPPGRPDHEPAAVGPGPHRRVRGAVAGAPPRRAAPRSTRSSRTSTTPSRRRAPRRADAPMLDEAAARGYLRRRARARAGGSSGARTSPTAGRPPHRGRLRVRDGGRARGPAHRDRAPGPADAPGGRLPPAGAPRPPRPRSGAEGGLGARSPAGTFAMGASGDGFAYDCERPAARPGAGAVPDRPRSRHRGRAPGLHGRRGLRGGPSSGPARAGRWRRAEGARGPALLGARRRGRLARAGFDRRRAGRAGAARCAT